jgi:hypothetical protein
MVERAFDVTYDGPELATGHMPVRDLAPALLALGEIFTEASVTVRPEGPPVRLNIRATEEGSFVIKLILESSWDQAINILSSDPASALANTLEIVAGGRGLFWLIKKLRGRAIVRHEDGPEPGEITIELADGTRITVPSETTILYRSVTVRRHVREVVEPLEREGVDELRFEVDHKPTVSISSEDVPAFDVPAAVEEPLGEHELVMVVSIASVAFLADNKWRLTDGDRTFYASIDDEAFLARVDAGLEMFRKGDMLRCRIRIVQSRSDEGLHTEYRVAEVLEHIPREIQLPLEGLDDDGASTA